MGVVVQIPSEDEKPQKDSFEPDIIFTASNHGFTNTKG